MIHFVVQRHVEQVDFAPDDVQIGFQRVEVAVPILSDRVERAFAAGADGFQKLFDERVAHMLDRVEADAVEVQFLGHPHTPVQQVVNDFRMIQIQIVSQQVVVVAVFGVYPFAPLLALAEYAEYLVDMLVVGALTGAREVIPVVLEVGVLVAASLEIVTGVRLDLVRLAHRLVPVRRIDLLSHELFGIVPSAFMVHHGVEVDLHSVLVQLVDGLDEFLLRSVFGPDRIFLVELSQIVQIVCRVALVLLLVRFVCGRNPYGRHACFVQVLGILFQFFPKVAVVGQIPFEILHHDSVSHNSIFLFFGYSALWRSARDSAVSVRCAWYGIFQFSCKTDFPSFEEWARPYYSAAVRTADRAETPMRSVGIGFGG